MTAAIAVFTHETFEEILNRGGTGYWGTKADRARQYRYAVCVRNENHPRSPKDVPHRSAFLIGKISGTEETSLRTLSGMPRIIIQFDEYAIVESGSDAWGNSQNPVWYTTIEQLGIDIANLHFYSMPEPQPQAAELQPDENDALETERVGDVLREAKEIVATRLGLTLENIEITIRV